MANEERIVREIAAILTTNEDLLAPKVTELANQYRDAVDVCNERLNHCVELLRKGHRTEAIQMSKADPDLLEMVSLLDFPGQEEWNAFVTENKMPAPTLQIDLASELNEAFVAEEGLAGLLRRHRLHALARSPLSRRIGVLRQIARFDRENPIWEKDIRLFEHERQFEISDETIAARKAGDVQLLAQLLEEVNSPDWIRKPSKKLVDQVVSAHDEIRVAKAKRELKKLEPQLTDAFSSLDVTCGRLLRSRWESLAAVARLGPEDPLSDLVAPALDWLSDEDQREAARTHYESTLAQLRQALDDNAPRIELERIYDTLARCEQGVPEIERQRVAERFQHLELAASRRSRQYTVASVAVVLFIGALVAFAANWHIASTAVQDHNSAVAALIDDDNLAGAQSYIDELKKSAPDIADEPVIQRQVQRINELVRERDERNALIDQYVDTAKRLGVTEADWDSMDAARDALVKAEELAKGDAVSISLIEGVAKSIYESQTRLQTEVDERFDKSLRELQTRVASLGEHDVDGLDQILVEAQGMDVEHVSAARKLEQELFVQQTNVKRKTAVMEKKANAQLEGIVAAVGQPIAFANRLKRFVEDADFTGSARANDFRKVLGVELALRDLLQGWDAMVAQFGSQDLQDPAVASEFLSKYRKLADAGPDFFLTKRFDPLKQMLEPIAARIPAAGDPLAFSLEKPLSHEYIADVYVVEDEDGRRYFTKEVPKFNGNALTFKYLTETEGDMASKLLSASKVKKPVAGEWRSPQTLFRERAYTTLRSLRINRYRDWEQSFVSLIETLFKDRRMDPLVRVQLLHLFLTTGCKGSRLLQIAYEKELDVLSRNLDRIDLSVSWWADGDSAARRERQKVQQHVFFHFQGRSPANLDNARANFADARSAAFERRYYWVGVALKNQQEEFQTRLNAFPKDVDSATLAVLVPDSTGKLPTLEHIGEFTNGVTTWDERADLHLVEGRPIYAIASNKS